MPFASDGQSHTPTPPKTAWVCPEKSSLHCVQGRLCLLLKNGPGKQAGQSAFGGFDLWHLSAKSALRRLGQSIGCFIQEMSTDMNMKRIHIFEFTDLSWYPDVFRRIQTDYLQFVASLGSGHKYLIPLFQRAMQGIHTNEIVDLCSGGTGPWAHLAGQLEQAGLPVHVTLTDKFPNQEAIQKLAATHPRQIHYLAESVDALDVPESLKGMRTLFEGFHHFKPGQAKLILQDAVNKKTAIGIFEASLKPPLGIILLLLSPLITIASYFLMTPLIQPRDESGATPLNAENAERAEQPASGSAGASAETLSRHGGKAPPTRPSGANGTVAGKQPTQNFVVL